MKVVLTILTCLLLLFVACNSNNQKVTGATAGVGIDSDIVKKNRQKSRNSIQDTTVVSLREEKLSERDSIIEAKVTNVFNSLKEVKQLIRDSGIWAKTGRRFSYMLSQPDSNHKDYVFQTGFESDIRFETDYWIHIDPKTLKVKFLDTLTDSLFSPADFRKLKR